MDVATTYNRKIRFRKALDKSFKGLHIGKNGKLSTFDKQKIKKTVATTYTNFLIKELKRPTTKTYDWYFTLMEGKVMGISHQRNTLGKNRYFIIDQDGEETLINNEFSFASTTGSERIRELEIYSPEISKIISGSKALFAGMMKITVSEKEDAKIHGVYDTVDEKLIIQMTLALPLLIIGAAEILPVMIAYGEGASLPTLGKAFTINSGRTALANGATEFGEQYFTRVMLEQDYNPLNVDWLDVGGSTIFSKPAAMMLNSSFDYTGSNGLEVNSLDQTARNLFNRKTKSYLGGKFNQTISGPIGSLSKPMGMFLDKSVNMVFRVSINKASEPEKYEKEKKK